jgi:regulator of sigma E protease
MLTLLIFIIVLGLLVFVHELGHFVVAKRSGMQVDEFGFGFPPRVVGIYSTPRGTKIAWGPKTPSDATSTIYSINLIPLGGFVRILGENNDQPDNPNSFTRKPFLPRLVTLLAGVVMNVVLAYVLVVIALSAGVPTIVDEAHSVPRGASLSEPKVTILDVRSDGPASKAGLSTGDELVQLNGQAVTDATQAREYIIAHKGEMLEFVVRRGSETPTLAVQSNGNPPEGQGPTGIALGAVGKLKYPWYKAVVVGFRDTAAQLVLVVKGLGTLVSGGVSLDDVGGPYKIAQLTGQASRLGFVYLLQFTSFLSLNLAVLNALPIPALDGGRVLFLIIETLRRKRNNPAIEQAVNAIGFLLLLLLMVLVTINDFNGFGAIARLFNN